MKPGSRHDLQRARRIVPFFLRRFIRDHPLTLAMTTVLNMASVGAQLAFLALLPGLLSALVPSAGTVTGPIGQALPVDLFSIGALPLLGVTFSLLLLSAAADFLQQRLVAKVNIATFRKLMRTVLRKLFVEQALVRESGRIGIKHFVNLFTKGCRYGSLIGYRATRLIRPLLAVPSLLVFCVLQSPLLTLVAFLAFALTLPFHLLLILRGIDSMRRLMKHGGMHATSKKTLISMLLSYPTWRSLEIQPMQKDAIDDGSEGYLKAYFDRRMLSALSTLLNVVAIAIALLVTFFLIERAPGGLGISVGELLVYLLALRFLVTNVGLIVTDLTMISSYTPMCEDAYQLLSDSSNGPTSALLPPKDGPIPTNDLLPRLIIFASAPIAAPGLQELASAATGDREWLEAPIIRGQYAPYYEDLAKDLYFDQDSLRVDGLSESHRADLNAALETERESGWNTELWESLPSAIRVHATWRAAQSTGVKRVILAGTVQTHLGYPGWPDFQKTLSDAGVEVLQIIEALPKGLMLPVGIPALFYGGERLESLGPIENYSQFVPTLRRRVERWREEMRKRDEEQGTFDDLDDIVG